MLQTPDEKTAEFIKTHAGAEVHLLALKGAGPGINLPLALRQIEGQQKARVKLPDWFSQEGILYPPKLSLEQCSSTVTANYKRQFAVGSKFADLTGGMGVDTLALSKEIPAGFHVEQQQQLSALASWNLPLLGAKGLHFIHSTADEFLTRSTEQFSLLYADPARRVEGRKVHGLSDCMPDIPRLMPLLKSRCERLLLKLSPMLDIQQALRELGHTAEVHLVEYEGECKELLMLLDFAAPLSKSKVIVALPAKSYKVDLGTEQEGEVPYAEHLHTYLYEPGPALMKSGRWSAIASIYGLQKIAPNTHLYTCTELHPEFPGKVVKVEGIMRYDMKEVQAFLRDEGVSVICRNFPDTPELVRKKLKVSDSAKKILFAFRDAHQKPIVVVGNRIDSTSAMVGDK